MYVSVIERERSELPCNDFQLPSPAPTSWGHHSLRPAPITLAISLALARDQGSGWLTSGPVLLSARAGLLPSCGFGLRPSPSNATSPCVLGLQLCFGYLSVLLGLGHCFVLSGLSPPDLAFGGCWDLLTDFPEAACLLRFQNPPLEPPTAVAHLLVETPCYQMLDDPPLTYLPSC